MDSKLIYYLHGILVTRALMCGGFAVLTDFDLTATEIQAVLLLPFCDSSSPAFSAREVLIVH